LDWKPRSPAAIVDSERLKEIRSGRTSLSPMPVDERANVP
jgi:hypothetical protein